MIQVRLKQFYKSTLENWALALSSVSTRLPFKPPSNAFCSSDLDLDPTTLMKTLDLYPHDELSGSKLSKVRAVVDIHRQTDRETDRYDRTYYNAAFVCLQTWSQTMPARLWHFKHRLKTQPATSLIRGILDKKETRSGFIFCLSLRTGGTVCHRMITGVACWSTQLCDLPGGWARPARRCQTMRCNTQVRGVCD